MPEERDSIKNLVAYEVEGSPTARIIINANECNFNLPESIRAELAKADFSFNRYPSMDYSGVQNQVAAELEIKPGQVFLGNGSSELLEKACYAFGGSGRKIAYPVPSFSMYETYVRLADSIPAPYRLTEEGFIDAAAVIDFCRREKPCLLILCNPNNPTGNFNSREVVEAILQNVECPVIADEAYMEFAQGFFGFSPLSTLELTGKYPNLLCFRTFSKAFGMAGMRVGYGVAAKALAQIMGKVLLPYHVNAYSLLVAETAYRNKDIFNARLQDTIVARRQLEDFFRGLGFGVFPTGTNFVMIQPRERDRKEVGSKLFHDLMERGILVRDFSSHPLLPGALRITVGTAEENEELRKTIQALMEVRS